MGSRCATGTRGFELEAVVAATDVTHAREYFGFFGVDHARSLVVASFKGTNGSVADFATDLAGGYYGKDCIVEGLNIGKVHAGFCDYWGGLQEAGFGTKLHGLAAQWPAYRVILTGHSLGAAVAVVGATFLAAKYPGFHPSVYTYGQPRVGDADFSDRFGSASPDSWRVVHRKDAVAHEPVCCWNWGGLLVGNGDPGCKRTPTCPYHSAGQVWYAGEGLGPADEAMPLGDYSLCEGPEDPKCGNWMSLSLRDHLTYFGVNVPSSCCYGAPDLPPALAVTAALLGGGGVGRTPGEQQLKGH
jgi:hypothetical protein